MHQKLKKYSKVLIYVYCSFIYIKKKDMKYTIFICVSWCYIVLPSFVLIFTILPVEIVVHFLPELEESFLPIQLFSEYVDPSHVVNSHATTVQLTASSHLTVCCTRVILVKINFIYGTLSEE